MEINGVSIEDVRRLEEMLHKRIKGFESAGRKYSSHPEVYARLYKKEDLLQTLNRDEVEILKKLMRKIIDHTLLRSDATREQINNLCREACEYGFYSVCVNSCHVPYVKERLEGTDVRVSATVSFPLGAELTKAKVCESVEAVRNGADELDMVINIGALKGGDYALVYEELRAIREEIGEGICLKVILENCYLNQEEKIIGCLLSKYGGADFVKTSTGFGSGGAEPDDIRLMRMVVGEAMGIKAAGGIRGFDTACEMVSAGATRIGTSSSMKIIT